MKCGTTHGKPFNVSSLVVMFEKDPLSVKLTNMLANFNLRISFLTYEEMCLQSVYDLHPNVNTKIHFQRYSFSPEE